MEIFSFVEPNSIVERNTSQKRFKPRKYSQVKVSALTDYGFDVAPALAAQSASSKIAIKKNVLLIIVCCACIALGPTIALLVQYVELYAKPVTFLSEENENARLLAEAMKNFVLEKNIGSIDAAGNIVLDTVSTKDSRYLEPVRYTSYTVRASDNITSIAQRFGLTNISTLISVNNIENVRRLRVGQKLQIPSIDGLAHTVAKNESIASIASKYDLSLERLVDVNDLSSATIQPGDTLFIPGAKLSSSELKKVLGEVFRYPLAVSWRLTSPYGPRLDPVAQVPSFHSGIDMAAPQGTPIYASMEGKVVTAGFSNIFGKYVIISHINGYQTLYGHMNSITVKSGQYVNQGAKVGTLGNTGYSTGAHLHFGVYKNGKTINPFDVLK